MQATVCMEKSYSKRFHVMADHRDAVVFFGRVGILLQFYRDNAFFYNSHIYDHISGSLHYLGNGIAHKKKTEVICILYFSSIVFGLYVFSMGCTDQISFLRFASLCRIPNPEKILFPGNE